MTTLGGIGHMNIAADSVDGVRTALRELLAKVERPLVGVSCLARGGDTLFAEAVLEAGGELVVVLPSRDYRERKVKPDHAETFDRLFKAAREVVVLDHDTARKEAYEDANRELLGRSERVVAVWDGSPPPGTGSTGDTVAEAREMGVPVDVVWPVGSRRD